MKKGKKWISLLLIAACLFQINTVNVRAEDYWPEGPQVAGESAIVMEASTGTVLYEKNSHEQLYPASITKIMTCLLAVENCNMKEDVTFSHDAVYKTEGSGISRDVDEVLTLEECLYALMLESANECAYAIAEHVGGTYDNFIKMMNDRAAKLGCKDTHFNNPHGLPDEQHYTSANDMALISREALKNETFRYITGTKQHMLPTTNKNPKELPMVNHHKMLFPRNGDRSHLYDGCIGGKTGYTSVAGSTLVTFAERDGMTLICVVMKEQSPNHYLDSKSLLDYCFENFQLWNVAENQTEYNQDGIESKIFSKEDAFVGLNKEGSIVLPKTAAFEDAVSKVTEKKSSDDVVGRIQYTYAGREVGGTEIEVTGAKVKEFPFEKEKPKKEEKVVKVNVSCILLGILAVVVLAGVGFGIYHFADNFYLIRYKFMSRKQGGFKEKKRRKRRHRRGKY